MVKEEKALVDLFHKHDKYLHGRLPIKTVVLEYRELVGDEDNLMLYIAELLERGWIVEKDEEYFELMREE